MSLPCSGHVFAMLLPCLCHVLAMLLQSLCHALAIHVFAMLELPQHLIHPLPYIDMGSFSFCTLDVIFVPEFLRMAAVRLVNKALSLLQLHYMAVLNTSLL